MKMTWMTRKWDVAVSIITGVFLLCILGAVGYQGREQAKRMVCAAHIRRNVKALLAYAADYDGMLPREYIKSWLEIKGITFVNKLLTYGANQETFYCPSNEVHQRNLMKFWMVNWGNHPEFWGWYWDGHEFKNYTSNSIIVSGYFFLLQEKGDGLDIQSYNTDTEKKAWLETVYMADASSRELVTDNIMGEDNEDAHWGYNFARIKGGMWSEYGIAERSNHLISDEEPAGGNVGFLDGHVTWRRWDPPTYPMVTDGKAVPRWRWEEGPACWW